MYALLRNVDVGGSAFSAKWTPESLMEELGRRMGIVRGFERFNDANGNGRRDDNEHFDDTNGNGRWDKDSNGVSLDDYVSAKRSFVDDNELAVSVKHQPKPTWEWIWQEMDRGEVVELYAEFQFLEPYSDTNGNEKHDAGESFTDSGNGQYDQREEFQDLNGNGTYDKPDGKYTPGEPFTDSDGSGKWEDGEPWFDGDPYLDKGNGRYDPGESFSDANGNGTLDGEPYQDLNGNGKHDKAPYFRHFMAVCRLVEGSGYLHWKDDWAQGRESGQREAIGRTSTGKDGYLYILESFTHTIKIADAVSQSLIDDTQEEDTEEEG